MGAHITTYHGSKCSPQTLTLQNPEQTLNLRNPRQHPKMRDTRLHVGLVEDAVDLHAARVEVQRVAVALAGAGRRPVRHARAALRGRHRVARLRARIGNSSASGTLAILIFLTVGQQPQYNI